MSVPAPIPTGVVSMLEGVVRVIRAGGKSAGALKVGDALQAGDVIFASAGTSFQLTGADGQLWTPPAGGLPADQATGVGDVAALADMRKALLAQGQASLDEAVARLNQATEEDAPADQMHMVALNAELARLPTWKSITKRKAPLASAEEWKDKTGKLSQLIR